MFMDSLSILWKQMVMIGKCYKLVHFDLMLAVYLVVYVVVSLIVWDLDPDIKGLSDALWFTFQTGTTIGYGDLIVNDPFARLLTALFSIYSLALVGIFTGIIAAYFIEMIKMKAGDTAMKFLLDLERLPEMEHDELVELSEKVKKFFKEE